MPPIALESDAVISIVESPSHSTYWQHARGVLKLSLPIILSEIFQNTLPVIDIAFVGQLGKDELGAAALATVWFNLFNTTFLGFMTSIDTLLSQFTNDIGSS